MTPEQSRLLESAKQGRSWKFWGPYLSEREWGNVREDYSANGDAWNYLTHDNARSQAYRWGEDGIAGISDDQQRLCFAIALWNGHDPFLKERLFGLTNPQGNHGEDVKEIYYYLDATPTNSWLKMLYKYPQRAFPYDRLVEENQRRNRLEPEFELLDTDAFDDDRYFDVLVEYAKASATDILISVTLHNRGPEQATLHVLPHLWFRNTWSWGYPGEKPTLALADENAVRAQHAELGEYVFHAEESTEFLFCENESNPRLWSKQASGFFKDGIHERVVHGNTSAVNPAHTGTKMAAHYQIDVPAGGERRLRFRLAAGSATPSFDDYDDVFEARRSEADGFYAELQRDLEDEDSRNVQRQAFAGMIWNKQFYYYDVPQWLNGDPAFPPPPEERKQGRNHDWIHLNNAEIISLPDKWEYPWYAAWDLAFHTLPFAMIDAEFAKEQLVLITREWYMDPKGQLPAYEWQLSDVNPPVQAWAAWRVFQIDRKQRRSTAPNDPGDLAFLERMLHKLTINFTWWVNRKDAAGRNIFQGGFLGLDNVGVFDRSAPLPTGGYLDQADGTSWMGMYCLNLLKISLELAQHNHVYEDLATKFFEHFLYIAKAMTNIGEQGIGLWDDTDGFFYDELNLPDGRIIPLRARSIVGLIPLFAVETLEPALLSKVPGFTERLEWFLNYRPDLAKLVSRWHEPGIGDRRLLSLLRGSRMKKLLRRMLDPAEFLSDHGVRSLSRAYKDNPYVFNWDGAGMTVAYEPAESNSSCFGGNSNWRGPVWMPLNYLLVESLQRFHHYYGDDFKIECPTGSGTYITIKEVSRELTRRLSSLFLRDAQGKRASMQALQHKAHDPHFEEHLLFYEYFDGDTGRGAGASHQTGWTGLIAKLLQPRS
jgi:hypothetical protein